MDKFALIKINSDVSLNVKDIKLIEGDFPTLDKMRKVLNKEREDNGMEYVVWGNDVGLYGGEYYNIDNKSPELIFAESKKEITIMSKIFKHNFNEKELTIINKNFNE